MKKQTSQTGVKEIARRGNVSIATVDRVIHNRPGVSAKTKARIEAIIKELNYQPNVLASRLSSGKVFNFAVIIPKTSVHSDFWEAPLKGITKAESEINQYGVTVETYFFDLTKKKSFIQATEEIKSKNVDGVLMSPSFVKEADDFFLYCQSRNIPVVCIDSNIDVQGSLSYIGPPLFQSGYVGASLCKLSISKNPKVLIVNISKQKQSFNFKQIEAGFKQFFTDLPNKSDCINLNIQDIDQESVELNLHKTFSKHPDIEAIFVSNSRVFAVADYLEKRGLKNIILVGYDFLKENQRHLKNGTINFLICHKPEEQGYKGIMSLYHSLALKLPVDKIYYMPIDIVTKENQEFYR
jgi:LacI family transcriptional regulator